jgi:hypothetical protein
LSCGIPRIFRGQFTLPAVPGAPAGAASRVIRPGLPR